MSARFARLAALLARFLLRLYPPSFRREMGAALLHDVRRRADELASERGMVRLVPWTVRLLLSLLANAAAARMERLRGRGPGSDSLARAPRALPSTFSWLDVKLGLRMLVKHPGLTVAGGTAIAVAIAVGAGFFGFMWAYFYPTIPLSEGDRLVGLENWDMEINNEERRSLHDFVLWRDEMRSVEDMAAYRTVSRNLIQGDGSAELVRVAEMTPSGFTLARVPPLLGRTLLPTDADRDAPPVLVIGYDVWRTRFTGDPRVIGLDVRLGRTVHTIVGVMPEGFAFPVSHDFWVPLKFELAEVPVGGGPAVFIAGRLAPGVTLEDAQAELAVLGQRMAALHPETHAQYRAQIMPYVLPVMDVNQQGSQSFLPQFAAFGGMFALLLVVLCVNVSILVYARTATRRGEIAVRTALGAPRSRIVAQLFVEALVLSSVAAAVGLLLTKVGLDFGQQILLTEMSELPFWMDLGIPGPALVYAGGLTLLAAVITGVIPALQATGEHVQRSLAEYHSGSGLRLGRLWTTLVIAQVGIAVLALPIAVATGWWQVRGATTVPTFSIERFAGVRLASDPETAPAETEEAWRARRSTELARMSEDLALRLEAEPGVDGLTFALTMPGEGQRARVGLAADTTGFGAGTGYEVEISSVGPDYFELVGARVTQGRTFTNAEREEGAADVVVVSRAFAERVLGGRDVLGRRIRFLPENPKDVAGAPESWHEVVGVVEDLQRNPVDPELVRPLVYQPLPVVPSAPLLLVRLADLDPVALAARVRSLAAEIDPTLRVMTFPAEMEYRQARLALEITALVLALILIAVLLMSSAGIYAMMSFTVTQRRREIGIRAALGAQPRLLLGGIFGRAAMQVGAGVLVGVAGAVAIDVAYGGEALRGLGRWLLPGMVVIMTAVGLAAAAGPARRGLAIAPSEVLKGE